MRRSYAIYIIVLYNSFRYSGASLEIKDSDIDKSQKLLLKP